MTHSGIIDENGSGALSNLEPSTSTNIRKGNAKAAKTANNGNKSQSKKPPRSGNFPPGSAESATAKNEEQKASTVKRSNYALKPKQNLKLEMNNFLLRFPHLIEQILQKLDNKGLAKSREIATIWQKFIDTRMYQWLRIVQIPTILNLKRGITYMHLAADYGQIDIFTIILDIEADKNLVNNKCDELKIDFSIKNSRGETAFHTACIGGKYKIAELIMKNSDNLKININEKNLYSRTAFVYACQNGHLEIVEMLVKNSESMNIELSIIGYHLACSTGQANIVKMLIDKSELLKLDLSPEDNWGNTGFHKACCAGHTDIAKILIDKSKYLKFDLSKGQGEYYWGNTGFHFACRNGHASIVEMLIDKSEFLNLDLTAISQVWGSTGFQLAVEKNQFDVIDVIKSKMPSLIVQGPVNIWTEHSNCQIHSRGTQKPL